MNREKVIKELELVKQDIYEIFVSGSQIAVDCLRIDNAIELLKEQGAQKFFVDESGKITPLPVVVRCKDCKHRPKEPNLETYESGFDLEFPKGSKCPCRCCGDEWYSWYPADDWFCADGERRCSE